MFGSLLALLAGLLPGAPADAPPAAAPALAEAARPGPVALVASPFAFEAPLAERLQPAADGVRVVLTLDAVDASDPLATRGERARRLAVTPTATDSAHDRAVADALQGAACVELLGGTWAGWCAAGLDGRHERRWTRALREAHARGAAVVATGGAAAWTARWSAQPRASVNRPAQVPHDTTPDVAVEGLGLVDGPLVAVLAPGEPTWDRAVERAVAYGWESLLLLEGDVAWVDFPAERRAEVHGPGAAAWIDLRPARRSREELRGARLALLGDGAAWDTQRDGIGGGDALAPDAPTGAARVESLAPLALRAALAGAPLRAADAAPARVWVDAVRVASDLRTRRAGAAATWSDLVLDARVVRPGLP